MTCFQSCVRRGPVCLTKAAQWSLTGVTALVWDRNESLIGDGDKLQEETSASVDSLRSKRRGQQRPARNRRGPPMDVKLMKKLASLEESETKTKTKTGCTRQKQAQMRKK